MQNIDQNKMLILASASPRRKDLLEQAGVPFCVVPSEFDEGSVEPGDPADYVRHLAISKADEVAGKHPDCWVLGADTVVLLDGRILEKPEDGDHAAEMLALLGGREHRVLTGYAVMRGRDGKVLPAVVETRVRFKPLTDEEIRWYVDTGEPFGKAGAYAIQGIGTFLVSGISGSYTNVVGLPVCEVIETLKGAGIMGHDPQNAGRYRMRGV